MGHAREEQAKEDDLSRKVNTAQIAAQEALPMRNSMRAPSEKPDADGRLCKYSNDGIHSDGMYATSEKILWIAPSIASAMR